MEVTLNLQVIFQINRTRKIGFVEKGILLFLYLPMGNNNENNNNNKKTMASTTKSLRNSRDEKEKEMIFSLLSISTWNMKKKGRFFNI